MTEQLTTRDGRTLAYRRIGSGPTLVCHPGGPGFSSLYLGDLGGLGQELELVLLDPRGTGGSDPARDPSGYAIADYAADVEELREHLGLERLLLLGHSHGGVVAIEYAAAHPDRVERLILASTLPRHGAEQEAAMQQAVEARQGEPWYEDAVDALQTELQGSFADGRELMELCRRMMPLYYADYGEREQRHVASLDGRLALRGRDAALGEGDLRALRHAPAAAEPDDADARDHRRAGLHHRAGAAARSSPRASRRPRRSCCRASAT